MNKLPAIMLMAALCAAAIDRLQQQRTKSALVFHTVFTTLVTAGVIFSPLRLIR